MHIERLELANFRNIRRAALVAENRTVAIIGSNGQGKTNLLEALYLCATGRSFRHAAPVQLINNTAMQASARATLERHEVQHTVEVRLTPNKRQILVDERPVRHVAALLELLNVVAFFPDDLRIIKGSPEERRRFLDRTAANGNPTFVQACVAYQHVLRHRNALLRRPAAPDRTLLRIYDEQLIEHGAAVHATRQRTLAQLQPHACEHMAAILGDNSARSPTLEFELTHGLPQSAPTACHDYRSAMATALLQSYPVDRARGMTRVGPHRADIVVRLNGHDARQYASQGEQRATVLALKLAELHCATERLGTAPILLLDDVSSELDARRNEQFFEAVASFPIQTWVSTTGAAAIRWPAGTRFYDVANGEIMHRI